MVIFLHLEPGKTTDLFFLWVHRMNYITSWRVYSESSTSQNKSVHSICKMILKGPCFLKTKEKKERKLIQENVKVENSKGQEK